MSKIPGLTFANYFRYFLPLAVACTIGYGGVVTLEQTIH